MDPGKILFLDIETVPQTYHWADVDERTRSLFREKTRYERERNESTEEQLYRDRSGILSEFGKIICIGLGFLSAHGKERHLRVKALFGANEREVLLAFVALLDERFNTPEHRLCGHNGKEFDFPYLARRCVVHGIHLPHLLDLAGKKPWEVPHEDTMELWKFGDRKHYTSLELLTHVLGIPSPKGDIKGSDVARVFYEQGDQERIAAYCKRDVVATVQVYLRLTGEPLVAEEHIVVL
jgi:3'-5' exonuclease